MKLERKHIAIKIHCCISLKMENITVDSTNNVIEFAFYEGKNTEPLFARAMIPSGTRTLDKFISVFDRLHMTKYKYIVYDSEDNVIDYYRFVMHLEKYPNNKLKIYLNLNSVDGILDAKFIPLRVPNGISNLPVFNDLEFMNTEDISRNDAQSSFVFKY